MAPPLGPSQKDATPVPESPASSQRPFDFADLGRPMPKSVRTLPPVPQADASGQLEELSGDDILESDDIDALEAAAAGYASFEVEAAEPYVAPQPVAAPAPEPSGFEVGDVGAFDEVEVEGIATRAAQPAAAPAPIGVVAVIAPVVKAVEPAPAPAPVVATKPMPSTLKGMPSAPVTSPLPLDQHAGDDEEESVVISEPAPTTARTPIVAQPAVAPAVVERTLEIRGNDMAKVAAAAAKLGSEPEQTEVLVRSAMPAALQTVRGIQSASGHTPAARQPSPLQASNGRPSSVAPVALDVSRSRMPAIPPMARVPSVQMPARGTPARPLAGLSGLAIGGMAAAAILLVSLVGIGGYAASRTLSAKTDTVEATPSDTSAAGEAATTAAAGVGAPSEAPSPAAGDPPGAASSPIDVSSLPSAPVPGAAPHGFTGKGSFAVTPPPLPVAVPAAPVAAAPVAAAPAAPVARSSGGALAAPGGGRSAPAGAPLPPPPSAPAAAPVAAAPAATTGVVHVDPNLRAVQVDGSYRHANDGIVVVSCGTHRIKVGMKEPQTVNIPCGGAVTL